MLRQQQCSAEWQLLRTLRPPRLSLLASEDVSGFGEAVVGEAVPSRHVVQAGWVQMRGCIDKIGRAHV